MDTPIYLITGFLESGKTHFIKELLTDDGFSAGERTLLLCCEEGEEEYEEQLLKDTNTVLVNLESPDDLNPRKLRELSDAYKPERVLVEYNAVWTMDRFFKTRVPRGWDIAQVVDLIDATTYALYVNNMRQMMTDGIVEADAVIFNRCDENTTKSPYRRQVRALNPSCSIIFDNLDGTSDDGVSDEDLPYDVKADPIHVLDEQFGVWYLDALEHPERYSGKNVKVKGQVFRMEDLPDNVYVLGRYAMTCCANDIGGIGFACFVDGPLPTEGEWVEVIAHMQEDMSPLHHRETIVLVQQKIKSAKKPEEEVVNFTN